MISPAIPWDTIHTAFEAKDPEAVAYLEHHTRPVALSYARKVLGQTQEAAAKDVVQNSYAKIQAYVSRGGTPPDYLERWYFCVLRNACMDHFRSLERQPRYLSEVMYLAIQEEAEDCSLRHVLGDLEKWLCVLSQRERDVLISRVCYAVPVPRIAAALELSPANVSKIRERAVKKLRVAAQADGYRVPA